jgi:hypothetical protein
VIGSELQRSANILCMQLDNDKIEDSIRWTFIFGTISQLK